MLKEYKNLILAAQVSELLFLAKKYSRKKNYFFSIGATEPIRVLSPRRTHSFAVKTTQSSIGDREDDREESSDQLRSPA